MGLDFRDFNNDGYPDIAFVALANQTFPLFLNTRKGDFREVTTRQWHARAEHEDVRLRPCHLRFRQRWLERPLRHSRPRAVASPLPGTDIDQYNTVFRNLGAQRQMASPHRRGRLRCRSPSAPPRLRSRRLRWRRPHRCCGHRALCAGRDLDESQPSTPATGSTSLCRGVRSNRDGIGARIKVVSPQSALQYNHMTTSVCYASSSDGPVHFGLGPDTKAQTVEIHWPSGIVQTLSNVAPDQTLKVTEPASPAR